MTPPTQQPPPPPTCRFCGARAEIELTRFDALTRMDEPEMSCRFCLSRPNRAATATAGAQVIRLRDLNSNRTATGQAAELGALLNVLSEQSSHRTITAAIRISSLPERPIALTCAACGSPVTPAKGGIVAWDDGEEGQRIDARVLHGHACAQEAGHPLRPGCWEDLDRIGTLDFTAFDSESIGFLTDVELAWKQLSGR
jgi:hypothetical protein